jgi:hypothetical protein
VDWEPLWPAADADQAKIVEYNFVAQVVIDPHDSQHLLITFHAKCAAPHPEACFGESNDAGATWRIVDGQSDWAGGEGKAVYFLENSRSWLWGSQSNGLWRSADSGASWQPVTDKMAQGHGAGQMYRSKSGVFYLPVRMDADEGLRAACTQPHCQLGTLTPQRRQAVAGHVTPSLHPQPLASETISSSSTSNTDD